MEGLRESFANTINAIGESSNLSANECERFGITWGCKEDCPVFIRGECELQEENEKVFNQTR